MTKQPRLNQRFLPALGAAGLALAAFSTAQAQTTVFGSNNDGLGGFTHTAIDSTTTFQTLGTDSVQYRNQNTGTIDAAFIKNGFGIDRTADSGIVYTMTGVVNVSDGYADDNNRLGIVLFTDPTKALSRNNPGQIGIVWNSDDNTVGGAPGNNASDGLSIRNGFNNADADATVTAVLRDQTTPFAQDLLQGTQIIFSATFEFVGADILISASMTDTGGVTTIGSATVLAADYTGEYFGFMTAYRARNYDGTPDPTGATRDNPLVLDYQSWTLTAVPEASSFALIAGAIVSLMLVRRRR